MWLAATFNSLQKTFTSNEQFSSDRCSAASFWKGAAKLLFEDNLSFPLVWLDSSSNYSSSGPVCYVSKHSRLLFVRKNEKLWQHLEILQTA